MNQLQHRTPFIGLRWRGHRAFLNDYNRHCISEGIADAWQVAGCDVIRCPYGHRGVHVVAIGNRTNRDACAIEARNLIYAVLKHTLLSGIANFGNWLHGQYDRLHTSSLGDDGKIGNLYKAVNDANAIVGRLAHEHELACLGERLRYGTDGQCAIQVHQNPNASGFVQDGIG